MRERLTRLVWPALIAGAFCIPLFVGLGRADVENDEGIYSFGVDGIVKSGDWLNPPSSPDEHAVFLEKPPLKFWIVAAPIRMGVLPHNEFGMRVWDALFGAIAFWYVFAIGRRMAGSICGLLAVMVLFVYTPLLFSHGLRGNNMEAPLFLAYCGAVFHWLAWAGEDRTGYRRGHVLALGLYFYLGFMTKFVAVAFLPMILGGATLLFATTRARLVEDWRHWLVTAGLFILVAAPWFIYQQITVGSLLWQTMFREHVYMRFTASVDSSHLQPWNYYFLEIIRQMQLNGTYWLAVAGGILLILRTIKDRWLTGVVVIAWFVLPLALIAAGTSKLQHYVYPFLPPLALAAGYGPAWLVRLLRPAVEWTIGFISSRTARLRWTPAVSFTLFVFALAALVVSAVTFASGPIRWRVAGITLFRNAGIVRPLVFATVLTMLAGRPRLAARFAAVALVVSLMPLVAYRRTILLLPKGEHPLRSARECLSDVRASEEAGGRPAPPLYAIAENKWFLHSYYYYLHHLGGWERAGEVDDRALTAALVADPRPVLITDADYRAFRTRQHFDGTSVGIQRLQHALLLMPGPYAVCGQSVSRHGGVP